LEPGEESSRAQWNAAPKRERSGAKPDPLPQSRKNRLYFCGFVVGGNAQIKNK